jgi:Uma2 family endonuclease
MSSYPKTFHTPEEYLKRERVSKVKHEYIDGQIVAMTGASRKHNLIVTNLVGELRPQLKGRSCELYANDMRVRVPSTGLYTYPDVVIVCGNPQFEDNYFDTLINPVLIIEVLSDSTESYDRGRKFIDYRSVQSLMEYILIAQSEYRIEHFLRQPDDRWLLSEARFLESKIELPTIQCFLSLREVYDKVSISDPA